MKKPNKKMLTDGGQIIGHTLEGQTPEDFLRGLYAGDEAIIHTAPLKYDSGEDVDPMCDIRTDKWEMAKNGIKTGEIEANIKLNEIAGPEISEES